MWLRRITYPFTGCGTYDSFQALHKKCVDDSLKNGISVRESRWTQSIATGGEQFAKKIKSGLGTKALGRQTRAVIDGYELRESVFFL